MRVRTGLLAAFGLAVAMAASTWAAPARAMALPAPSGLNDAASAIDVTEKVGCRTVWRCGRYGCGWRRVCWTPRYYHRPYGYHRPYRTVRVYRYARPYPYYGRPYRVYRPYRHYRPYVPPPWVSGPYYRPALYFSIGPRFYW